MSCHVSRLKRIAPIFRPSGSSVDSITLIADLEVITVLGASSSDPFSASAGRAPTRPTPTEHWSPRRQALLVPGHF
jgi:hypothetical protein